MDYYKLAVGTIGIDPIYFWEEMTMEEFDKLAEARGEQYRDEWERTRIIAYYSASGFSKMPTIKKFMPFSWDNKVDEANKPKIKPSKDRMNAIINIIKKQKNGSEL